MCCSEVMGRRNRGQGMKTLGQFCHQRLCPVMPKPEVQKSLRSISESLILARNIIQQNTEENVSGFFFSFSCACSALPDQHLYNLIPINICRPCLIKQYKEYTENRVPKTFSVTMPVYRVSIHPQMYIPSPVLPQGTKLH